MARILEVLADWLSSQHNFYGITAHFGFWDKPPRARKHHWFPDARLQYAQLRKRRRGWHISFLYSIIRLGSRQLIRSGLKALALSGLVRDLLQLPVPEGIWLDTFPAAKGCR